MKITFLSRRKESLTHIAGWLTALLINLLMMDNFDFKIENIINSIPIWVLYVITFYINYLILMPKLLFKKHIAFYIFVSLIVLSISFGFLRTYFLHGYEKDIRKTEVVDNNKFEKSLYVPVNSTRKKEVEKRLAGLYSIKQYNPLTRRNMPILYGLLLVFSTSMLLRFFERWKEEERNRISLDREKISSELEYLKQQINPHFLFNALNSIYSLTLPHSDVASASILKLSSIMRYMLYETDQQRVPLADEINIINDYIGLQKLRLTDKTKLSYSCTGSAEGYKIEPLLLIPFIENAFKYGVDSADNSFIDISLIIENDILNFEVRNKVVTHTKDTKNSGIGIKNVMRRLDLLYTDMYKLTIKESEGNFIVYLNLPLQKI